MTDSRLNRPGYPPLAPPIAPTDTGAEGRPLNITDTADAQAKISDVQIVGNPDVWRLVCKASSASQGFMKSTKIMALPRGCLVQVSTQQRNPDGSFAVAEALTFVPQFFVEGPLAP